MIRKVACSSRGERATLDGCARLGIVLSGKNAAQQCSGDDGGNPASFHGVDYIDKSGLAATLPIYVTLCVSCR